MRDENIFNVRIVGTHHLLKEEIIRKEIESFNPEIVLIELCNGRITLIEHPELQKKTKLSLLGLISKAITKKAEAGGIKYGRDLISAYKISKEKGIQVGLIDKPIVETNILFKSIPLKEKIQLLTELKKFSSNKIKIQDVINEVESNDTKEVIKLLKNKCPSLHYFLITSRDEYMINKIKAYLYDHPEKRILIFIGDGHRKTIEDSLKLK